MKTNSIKILLTMCWTICTLLVAETVMSEGNELEVRSLTTPFTINMCEMSNSTEIIMYNDIIYIPISSYYGGAFSALGLEKEFSKKDNLLYINRKKICEENHVYIADREKNSFVHKIICDENNLPYDLMCPIASTGNFKPWKIDETEAKIADIATYICGELYNDNDYPIIECRNEYYMPLTYAVCEKLDFIMYYTVEKGLSIYSDSHFEAEDEGYYKVTETEGANDLWGRYWPSYYTVGTTVIRIKGSYRHSNYRFYYQPFGFPEISINGSEFKPILQENSSWRFGVSYSENDIINSQQFRPCIEFHDGTLKINAVNEEVIKEDGDTVISNCFANLTINVETGKIMTIEPKVKMTKKNNDDWIVEILSN